MKMKLWIETAPCKARAHCDYCLGNRDWHESLSKRFETPVFGSCPFGVTLQVAQHVRAEMVDRRVADGKLTARQAAVSLTAVGINVD